MPENTKKVVIIFNSTDKEETDLILAKLRKYIVDHNFTLFREIIAPEKATLGKTLEKLLYPDKKIDVVLVWEISHIGLSLREIGGFFSVLDKYRIDLISIKNRFNTTGQGKQIYAITRELVKFESDTKRKSIKAGIAKARIQGKKLGRPELPANILDEARELRAKGLSYKQIGKLLNINETTVRKKIK